MTRFLQLVMKIRDMLKATSKALFIIYASVPLGHCQNPSQLSNVETALPDNTPAIEAVKSKENYLSLEELLKTEVPELAKENAATNENWRLLIDSLSRSDFQEADKFAQTLLTDKSVLAPLRFELCVVYKDISFIDPDTQKTDSPALVQILKNDKTLNEIRSEKQALLNERPLVYKKIEDKNKSKATSALIGSLIGAGLGAGLGAAAGGGNAVAIGAGTGAALGAAGGYGYAAADSPEVRLQYIEKRLQEVTIEDSTLESRQNQLRLQLSQEERQKENEAVKSLAALKERALRLMDRFAAENEFQPSIAIGNAFLKLRGMDAEVSLKSAEIFQEETRVAKIVRIATVIKKEVLQILNKESSSTKPWTAFAELQKKIQMVKNSIQDNKYIKILEKELFGLQEDLEMTMRTASKQRESLVSLAERDAEDAFPKIESYGAFYQDDPEFSSSWLRVKDLRQKQAEEKVQYYMSSVEAVLLADPERAKVLLSELLDKEVPPIQRSILEAKIASAFKRLHGHEIKLIRADVDEAHSFLSKYALETGAEPANVDLSKLKGDLKFDQYKEREDTTMSGGLDVDIPILASGGIQGKLKKSSASNSAEARAGIENQTKLFSFTTRLFIGIENINRCLSLLEGANVRTKELRKDKNLDKSLAGRLDGLSRSIEISLLELKAFRSNEINARKYSWAAISSGLCLTVLAGAGGLIKIARRKSK